MLATEQTKDLIQFPENRPYDMILLGRVAIDFNPIDYFKTLAESATFKKYVGGSPANTARGPGPAGPQVRILRGGVPTTASAIM